MIKHTLIALGTAARALFRNRGALALFGLLYVALLVAVYMFFSTREATVTQLVLTTLYALLAPLFFFILQAAIAAFAATDAQSEDARAVSLLRFGLKNFWKVILVAVPVAGFAVLAVYLLNKLQTYFPLDTAEAARNAAHVPYPQTPPPAPLHWPSVLLSTLRLLSLGVVLPLAAVHLWLAIARVGLKETLKRSPRILARGFAPAPVLAYAVGLFAFGLLPYMLIFTRTPIKNAWGELILFGVRLALAFVFSLWGWVITLGALAQTAGTPDTTTDAVAQTADARGREAQAQA